MSTVFALQKPGGREGDGELLWGPRGRQRLDFKGLRCGSEKPNARDPCKKMRPDKRCVQRCLPRRWRHGVTSSAAAHAPASAAPPRPSGTGGVQRIHGESILTAASESRSAASRGRKNFVICRAPDARPLSPNDLRESPC
jgi:hypothetical protein